PYRTQCMQCGRGTPPYRYDLTGDPFYCRWCGTPYLPLSDRSVLELTPQFREAELRAWSGFARWWGRFGNVVEIASCGGFPRRTEDAEPLARQTRSLWVLNEIVPVPRSIRACMVPRLPLVRVRVPRELTDAPKRPDPLTGDAAAERK